MQKHRFSPIALLSAIIFLAYTHTAIIAINQEPPEAQSAVSRAPFLLNSTSTIENEWQTGYQVTVTVENNTQNPTSSWQATFELLPGQMITSLWNGAVSISGNLVTVKNPQWYGGNVIPAYSSTTFGMVIAKPLSSPIGINSLSAVANGNSQIPTPVPQAPLLNPITVNAATPTLFTVSWNNVAYATSYLLQEDTANNFPHPVVVAQGTMLSQSLTKNVNGIYYYRVSASNGSGTSQYSNTQNVVVDVKPIVLNAPVLQPINNPSGANKFQMSWTAVTNAQSYGLQQSQTANFSTYSTVFSGNTTSTQVSVNTTGTYYYRVIALAQNATSSPSNVVNTTVTQVPPQPKFFIDGYWESWNSQDPVAVIANMHVDIINISFANFKTTGLHTYEIAGVECDQATLQQLISVAHSLNKKVKIAVGGAAYPISPQLQTIQDAVGMAKAVATYVTNNSLDGVDYDIEDYPAVNLQVALLLNTRQFLPNALITYTPKSPASTTNPYAQVIKNGHQYMDYLSIMAYDNSPDYRYQEDVRALLAMGVPASKIVVGLMPGVDDLGVMTAAADISTAAQYIKQNNLAGIMFWDLNRDYENVTGLGKSVATNTAWNVFHT